MSQPLTTYALKKVLLIKAATREIIHPIFYHYRDNIQTCRAQQVKQNNIQTCRTQQMKIEPHSNMQEHRWHITISKHLKSSTDKNVIDNDCFKRFTYK